MERCFKLMCFMKYISSSKEKRYYRLLRVKGDLKKKISKKLLNASMLYVGSFSKWQNFPGP